jgi:hypothetical protein
MSTVPNINPVVTPTLSPLQLALLKYLVDGTPRAFDVNQRFLNAMRIFSDSIPQSPLTIDPRSGLPRQPDISKTITGLGYYAIGDDIYIYRQTSTPGVYEYALIGKRSELPFATWVYYAAKVSNGVVSSGSDVDFNNGAGI